MEQEGAGRLKVTIELEVNKELMDVMRESIQKMPEMMRGQMGRMFRGNRGKETETE